MIDTKSRLQALRKELEKSGMDGFFVPLADAYQNEYVPASDRRLAFLSGFTGSAGSLIVLKDKAVFFTDGRYTIQAQQQVSPDLFTVYDSGVKSAAAWLEENTKAGMRLAYDPWLHTTTGLERLKKAVAKSGAVLVPVEQNLVDLIWFDRPSPPVAPVTAYDLVYAGKNSVDKRRELADDLKKQNLSAAVLTDPASVAWLLNIRGGDVPHVPLPLSFAVVDDAGAVQWFVDPRKVTEGLDAHLGGQVQRRDISEFPQALDALALHDKSVRLDPAESASWILDRLRAAKVKLDLGVDPCVLPKACKNPVEVAGMRAAHRRDGAALAMFFAWLSVQPVGTVTERSAEEKLETCRAAQELHRGPSFDTIAGAGDHGAIVHYRATETTNRALEANQLFLLDSGGQYLDGTTDVTRTMAVGVPTPEMKDRFTRVLKGHVALASVRFPEGTTGGELEILARQSLWELGLDYNHGTGHGVGSYLGVHEGPQGISRRNAVPLKQGMVLSNEPGYYKAGFYGIRIENLQVVVERAEISTGARRFLGFETLTLVPLDHALIEISLLTEAERCWINAYHAHVRETLRPLVDAVTMAWLVGATREI